MVVDPLIYQASLGVEVALGISALLVGGWAYIRYRQQVKADRMHRTYELHFPGEGNLDKIYGTFRAFSGLDRPDVLKPIHTISIEEYSDYNGIRYLMHIAGHMHERVDTWLQEHLDVVVEELKDSEDPVRNTDWTKAVELSLGSKPLNVKDPHIDSISTGVRFKHMLEDEKLARQWIIFPASKHAPTPETKDKESSTTFHAIPRIAAVGERPDLMIKDVLSGYSVLHAHNARFRIRHVRGVIKRVQRRAGTFGFMATVNEPELATLCGWPLNGTAVTRAKLIPPTAAHDLPGPGKLTIGESNSPRTRGRKIAIPMEGLYRHTYMIGKTGTGKSKFLETLALGGIREGMSVIVIEPHGDLAYGLANKIPKEYIDRVILFDPMDDNWPVGINVMNGDDPERIRGHVLNLINTLSPDSKGPRQQRILGNAVFTAALCKLSLYDLLPLLTNKHYRTQQLKKINKKRYPRVHEDWTFYDGVADNAGDSSINALNALLGSERVAHRVAQTNGLDFNEIIREGKVLLVPLPNARIGMTGAKALGRLIFEMAYDAALRVNEADRRPSLVIADEFHHFSDNDGMADRFAEARKYKQSYALAHQYLKQIDDKVLESIRQNVQNPMAFQVGPDDAKRIASMFPPMKEGELAALPTRGVVARLYGSNGYTPTVTFRTLDSPPNTGSRRDILTNTRMKYATPLAKVLDDIAARHKGPEPKEAPPVGRRARRDGEG